MTLGWSQVTQKNVSSLQFGCEFAYPTMQRGIRSVRINLNAAIGSKTKLELKTRRGRSHVSLGYFHETYISPEPSTQIGPAMSAAPLCGWCNGCWTLKCLLPYSCCNGWRLQAEQHSGAEWIRHSVYREWWIQRRPPPSNARNLTPLAIIKHISRNVRAVIKTLCVRRCYKSTSRQTIKMSTSLKKKKNVSNVS